MLPVSGRGRYLFGLLVAGLLLQATRAGASSEESVTILRAYGPGGPHHVLKECADLFKEKFGVTVAVFKASPGDLARNLLKDGDLYFGGAGYMLDQFARENPGVLDLRSVKRLHPRRIGIVVRKGNPLNIKGVDCLQREDIDLLAVRLENMTQFHPPRYRRRGGARRQVYTGQDGVQAWRSSPEFDAWVTYESWHVQLEEESDFIEIPGDHALRFTPVALTKRTPHREAAQQFLAFLESPEARRIFVEHGWE